MQWSWPDAGMLAGPQPPLCTWTGAGRGPGFRIRASGQSLTACGPGEATDRKVPSLGCPGALAQPAAVFDGRVPALIRDQVHDVLNALAGASGCAGSGPRQSSWPGSMAGPGAWSPRQTI